MPRIGQSISHIKINANSHPIDAVTIDGKEMSAFQESGKLVTSINSSSDDQHYPSAKCLYDIVGDLNQQLNPAPVYSKNYLTFEAIEDTSFNFTKNELQYSIDEGITWNTLSKNTNTPIIRAGKKIMFKQNTFVSDYFEGMGTFSSNGRFNLSGNIMSLVSGDNFENLMLFSTPYIFTYLFRYSKVVDASKLILPLNTLTQRCYCGMFAYCRNLINPPQLPATTLASSCYAQMFYGCISLTSTPQLPATTLVYSCYSQMFGECTSLTSAPQLPAMTMEQSCYSSMFQSCSSLTSAPNLPATTLARHCYSNMFNGCIKLISAPQLPATTLAEYCYGSMFKYCSSLISAPVLPATTLVTNCYLQMFFNCINLNYIKCYAVNNIIYNNLIDWVHNVSSTGTFIGDDSSMWHIGNDGIPENWYTNVQIIEDLQSAGLYGMYVDSFIENWDYNYTDWIKNPGYYDSCYYEYCEPFEYDGNEYYIWILKNDGNGNEKNRVKYILTDTIDYNELISMSLKYDLSNLSTYPITAWLDYDFNETYVDPTKDYQSNIIKIFKLNIPEPQSSHTIGMYVDDFLIANPDDFVENPIGNGSRAYEYTGDVISYDGDDYYVWKRMSATPSNQIGPYYALTDTINQNTLQGLSLQSSISNISNHPIYVYLNDNENEYSSGETYNIISVSQTTGLEMWIDRNFEEDWIWEQEGYESMDEYLDWYLDNLDDAGGKHYYYIDEFEYDGDTCYIWCCYLNNSYLVTNTNNVSTLQSYSIESNYSNVNTHPILTFLRNDLTEYFRMNDFTYSIVKVTSSQPKLMMYVDDFIKDNFDFTNFINNPIDKGTAYYEYCEPFEYDGNEYYIWIFVDTSNNTYNENTEMVKYLLTDTINIQTLQSDSLKNSGNIISNHIISYLDEDFQETYTSPEKIGSIIKVFEIEPPIESAGTLGMYVDDFPDPYCWENDGFNDMEDYLEEYMRYPESGCNYYEYCREFEYDGDTYYIWINVDETGGPKYLLTDTNNFQTLYNASIEVNLQNVDAQYNPLICYLNDDLELVYENDGIYRDPFDRIVQVFEL